MSIKEFIEQVDNELFEEATIDKFQHALAKTLVRKSHSKISIEDAHKLWASKLYQKDPSRYSLLVQGV